MFLKHAKLHTKLQQVMLHTFLKKRPQVRYRSGLTHNSKHLVNINQASKQADKQAKQSSQSKESKQTKDAN
jgi:hypothetical protein